MSSIQLKFGVIGGNKMHSIFDHLEHVPDDMRPAFEQMAEDFWKHEQEVFDSAGPGWKPLSPRYAIWKAKHYPGMGIMQRTGALKASLTSGFGSDSVFEVYPQRMTIGTDSDHGIFHQTGSIKVQNHPPKRVLMKLDAGLQKQWNRDMVNWLRDELDYRG